MKIQDTIAAASSSLWRNKGRTILTIVAIFIGAFTISITTGITIGVNDYINKQVANVGRKDQLSIMKKVEQNQVKDQPKKYEANQSAADDYLMQTVDTKKITAVKGLTDIEENQAFQADYIQSHGAKYELSAGSAAGMNVDLKAGRQVSATSTAFEIVLAPQYVKSLGFASAKQALKQTVKLAATSKATKKQTVVKATIVGVRNKSIINNGESIVNPALADKLVAINQAGMPAATQNEFYGLTARVKHPTKANIQKIKERLAKKGYTATTFEDELGSLHSTINAVTGVLTLFGAIALLAASFGIINTLYMSVQDRTREIGLMKAMGMGGSKVFLIFSVEALLIGLWGATFGVMAAFGAGKLINRVATHSFIKGLDGLQLIQFSWPATFAIIAVIMLIAFLAGTLPAKRAARLDPIEALRYE
ncbi:ABC transporter permease [Enterococcus sp. CSURQ0835]|uniref:ABC transporter permease n=1 Tax=Enterococcus sp. CSURQ0835 TaxID=2681394 RepID=UPI00135CE99D|nr:ABC transporter permease [Enterococcus sp. CSURQ0835]